MAVLRRNSTRRFATAYEEKPWQDELLCVI